MKYLGWLILFISCHTYAMPEWVSKPSSGCKKSELCAVGIGTGMALAKSDARANIAKIFETKVSSEFSSELTEESLNSSNFTQDIVKESTDLILKGVSIKEVYEGKISTYALAVLDKFKASREIKEEISRFDIEMSVLLKKGGASSSLKAKTLYEKRTYLASKYRLLTNIDLPEIVTFEEIYKKQKKALEDKIIHIQIAGENAGPVKDIITSLFVQKGFKVTTGSLVNKKATHILRGNFSSTPAFLKVEGFEKYKYHLELDVTKRGEKVKIGHIVTEEMEVGRNFEQSFNKALPEIKSYLEEHFVEFNID